MTEQPEDSVSLWRYISFAKLVSILQQRALWFSRIDLLGDPWELQYLLQQVAPEAVPVGMDSGDHSNDAHRLQRTYEAWSSMMYVCCWSRDGHESHALWRIYCPSSEGLAIQTTVAGLREIAGVDVRHVDYNAQLTGHDGSLRLSTSATAKRPMYAYEREVRALMKSKDGAAASGILAPWDIERHVHNVVIHPEAHEWFRDTVMNTVERYAPSLTGRVKWSDMRTPPPFARRGNR